MVSVCRLTLIVDRVKYIHHRAPQSLSFSSGRWIGRNSLVGKLPKQVRHVINRRRQQSHDSLEWGVVAGGRVAARWYKRLVSTKRRRQLLSLLACVLERCFEAHEVLILLSLDVLREGCPDLFELVDIVRVGGTHTLERLEQFLDLGIHQRNTRRLVCLPRSIPDDALCGHLRLSVYPCLRGTSRKQGRRLIPLLWSGEPTPR
jgi:hypothetical protein